MLLSLPFEGRWPGERRGGGVKIYQFCGVKPNLSPLSRLWRQLPSEGSLGNDKSQLGELGKERAAQKAGAHRDLYAPKRIFSCNTALKSHGRRQPCHGFFSCLAEKPFVLECFAVLKSRFFLTENTRGRGNTLCIARTMDFLWGKRFFQNRVNPYVSPPRAAHIFYFCDNCTITTVASSLVR